MQYRAAELLVKCSGNELEIRDEYRGRGGVGPTTGVVGQPSDFNRALADFIRDAHLEEWQDRVAVADAVESIRQDGMGLETIWY